MQIYALTCPETGAIRYIGKARVASDRLKRHLSDAKRKRTPVQCWIDSLANRGLMPVLNILAECEDWVTAERHAIAYARSMGLKLLNLADGGNEPYCSPEVRAANGRKSIEARRQKLAKLGLKLGQAW